MKYTSPDARRKPFWVIFSTVVDVLLVVMAGVAIITQEWDKALAFIAFAALNTLHDIYTEIRASRQLAEIQLRVDLQSG